MNNNRHLLNDLINEQSTRSKPKRGEIYKHFKGKYYIVEDIAYDTERNAESVVYRAAYGECKLFVRDLRMFMEILPNGTPRFARVDAIPEAKGDSSNLEVHTCPHCGCKNEFNPKQYKSAIQQLPMLMMQKVKFMADIQCKQCGRRIRVNLDLDATT